MQKNTVYPVKLNPYHYAFFHDQGALFYKSETAGNADEATSYTMLAWSITNIAHRAYYAFGPMRYRFKTTLADGEKRLEGRHGIYTYHRSNIAPLFKYDDTFFVAANYLYGNAYFCAAVAVFNSTTLLNIKIW